MDRLIGRGWLGGRRRGAEDEDKHACQKRRYAKIIRDELLKVDGYSRHGVTLAEALAATLTATRA